MLRDYQFFNALPNACLFIVMRDIIIAKYFKLPFKSWFQTTTDIKGIFWVICNFVSTGSICGVLSITTDNNELRNELVMCLQLKTSA